MNMQKMKSAIKGRNPGRCISERDEGICWYQGLGPGLGIFKRCENKSGKISEGRKGKKKGLSGGGGGSTENRGDA